MRHFRSGFKLCGTLVITLSTVPVQTQAQPPSKLITLHMFAGSPNDGADPLAGVVIGRGGELYGTTFHGGSTLHGDCLTGCGTVFSLRPPLSTGGTWTEDVYIFQHQDYGVRPYGGLAIGRDGLLYGTTWTGGCGSAGAVFSLEPPTFVGGPWNERVLSTLGCGLSLNPEAALAIGSGGVLYGTTNLVVDGLGSVFSLTPPASGGSWSFAEIHEFLNFNVGDGAIPSSAGVSIDANGILYGTASEGIPSGMGMVYSLAPPASPAPWAETILYRFMGGSDGSDPQAGVVIGPGGALYGTTYSGGTSTCPSGCGTVFQLTPPASSGAPWTETILHTFTGGSDGANPQGGVAIGSGGKIYGTTTSGGTFNNGTVFSLTPPASPGGSWTETILHSFTGGTDGGNPQANVVIGVSGALYGTTAGGGNSSACSGGCGTVFALAP
jgi:uncharacterized repeat protein (TIGR03803 family)